jgi:dimethylargininase
VFDDYELIHVADEEPFGANALLVQGRVIYPSHLPRTAERLTNAGIAIVQVPCNEIAKAEGAVTCCSLVFDDTPSTR